MNNLAHNNKIDPHFMIDLKVNPQYYFQGRDLTPLEVYKEIHRMTGMGLNSLYIAYSHPDELSIHLDGWNYTKSQVKALSHSLRNDNREQWIDLQERQGLK